MKRIELLAPAGSPEALDAAVAEGADAVYLGLRTFNARLRSANFAYSQFDAAVRILHKQGRRVYVAVNTVLEQREADRMYQFLKYLNNVGPDALIVQDFGVARMAREYFPELRLHASTQMNIASAKGANALSRRGFSRVVLSRELDLDEIANVRGNTAMELEVFIHGALCVSASGLCLFSSFLGGKSANRGLCAQACRRRYHIGRAEDGEGIDANDAFDFGDTPAGDVSPDEGAVGYFFSPSDLQLADGVGAMADMGVTSLKIEGRMKSAEYVGVVVSAYRRLIDALDGDREKALVEARAILKNDFARPKTAFYWNDGQARDWLDPRQAGGTGIALGKLVKTRSDGDSRLGFVRPDGIQPQVGDTARFHKADDSDRKSLKLNRAETANDGVWISIPDGFAPGDPVYLIQTRAMGRRYQPVLPHDLSGFRRQPGHDTVPPPPSRTAARLPAGERAWKSAAKPFPDGLYAAVSRIEDLYLLQASRPIRAMLHYTQAVAERLLKSESDPLPFSKGEMILVLDPFFPPAADARLSLELPQLLEAGYRQFMVNNLGQIALFRDTPAQLAAGPYLYAFNRWAFDFIADYGLSPIVTPLENNRQNLDRAIDPSRRGETAVTVFAYPALFRIKADLSPLYDFDLFSDGRGDSFRLVSSRDGSRVYPETPFSIVDKIPFLKESGINKFILDFSGPPLKKIDYKDVMDAAKTGRPLPNTSRFNWKDGFFNPEEKLSGLSPTEARTPPRTRDAGDYTRKPMSPNGGRPERSTGGDRRERPDAGGYASKTRDGGGRAARPAGRGPGGDQPPKRRSPRTSRR